MGLISIRLSDKLHKEFENALIDSGVEGKPEFIKLMLNKFLEPKETKPEAQLIEPEPTIIEKEIRVETEKQLAENEIIIRLTPTQLFALTETILSPDYVSKTNEFVECVNKGIDPGSFFTKENVYAGIYQGDILPMGNDLENEETLKSNIAALLLNVFMTAIIQENSYWIGSPVTHKMLKAFKKQLLLDENQPEKTEPWNQEN